MFVAQHAVLAGKIDGIPVTYNIWDLTRFHRYETSGHAREKIIVNFREDFGASPEQAQITPHQPDALRR